ncbi:MAG: HNH endonuclease [Pseudoflavonifractor sp.]|nr:HNH endonuclease [Pseudoflavonifractor sp.]
MAKDRDYIRMIHTARWLRLRRDILTSHPLCQQCGDEGRIAPATEVHHIRPVEYGINRAEKHRLMFDPANLRTLCHGCHVRIHTDMGRSGKQATKRRNEQQVKSMINKFFSEEI